MRQEANIKKAVRFIRRFTHSNGRGPSCRELAHGIGLSSPASGLTVLLALQRRGLVHRCTVTGARTFEARSVWVV